MYKTSETSTKAVLLISSRVCVGVFYDLKRWSHPAQYVSHFFVVLNCISIELDVLKSVTWTLYKLLCVKMETFVGMQRENPWRPNTYSRPGIREGLVWKHVTVAIFCVQLFFLLSFFKPVKNIYEIWIKSPGRITAIGLHSTYVLKEVTCSRCRCKL